MTFGKVYKKPQGLDSGKTARNFRDTVNKVM